MIKDIFWKIFSTFTSASGDQAPIILMYHSIGHNGAEFTVTPEHFDEQIEFLRSSGKECLALSEFIARLNSGRLAANAVAVTFDDGYEDNRAVALPILKKHAIPATIFLSTAYIGKTFTVSDGVPLLFMDETDVKELSRQGLIDFESHGHWHKVMRDLTKEDARQDILESKRIIESLTGKTPIGFAYPYGKCSDEMLVILKELGFRYAVTVKEGLVASDSDRLQLPRMAVVSSTSLAEFKCKVGKAPMYLAIRKLVADKKARQICRYITSGGLAAAVNVGLLYMLTDLLNVWYLLSATIAFVLASGVSFALQKFWTFNDPSYRKIHVQASLYLMIAIVNLCINDLLMYVFVESFHIWYILSQVISSGLIALISFFVYKYLVFHTKPA